MKLILLEKGSGKGHQGNINHLRAPPPYWEVNATLCGFCVKGTLGGIGSRKERRKHPFSNPLRQK